MLIMEYLFRCMGGRLACAHNGIFVQVYGWAPGNNGIFVQVYGWAPGMWDQAGVYLHLCWDFILDYTHWIMGHIAPLSAHVYQWVDTNVIQ